MLKPVIALAALAAILSATGCCWPHGHHGRGYYSESSRPRPAPGHFERHSDGR